MYTHIKILRVPFLITFYNGYRAPGPRTSLINAIVPVSIVIAAVLRRVRGFFVRTLSAMEITTKETSPDRRYSLYGRTVTWVT